MLASCFSLHDCWRFLVHDNLQIFKQCLNYVLHLFIGIRNAVGHHILFLPFHSHNSPSSHVCSSEKKQLELQTIFSSSGDCLMIFWVSPGHGD